MMRRYGDRGQHQGAVDARVSRPAFELGAIVGLLLFLLLRPNLEKGIVVGIEDLQERRKSTGSPRRPDLRLRYGQALIGISHF